MRETQCIGGCAPFSPDLHQVIEHSIAIVTSQFRSLVLQRMMKGEGNELTLKSADELHAMVKDVFEKHCTTKVIQANVAKLAKVWAYVVQNKGHYACSSLR